MQGETNIKITTYCTNKHDSAQRSDDHTPYHGFFRSGHLTHAQALTPTR
jgi:hypothetical protein